MVTFLQDPMNDDQLLTRSQAELVTWYDSGDESERNTCHTIEYKFDDNNNKKLKK